MIAGVDEAGRGPVLGPLVVAGVACEDEKALRKLGAKDSKQLSPEQRAELAPRIREATRWEVRVLEAEELNTRMRTATLNEIEVDAFADVLRALAPQRAVVDACDVDEARFGHSIARRLPQPCFPILSRHGADARHAIVGAASIVAKVARDAAMADIGRALGREVGSGYASDPATRAFLEAWRGEHGGALPPHTRIYWATVADARPNDRRLGQFAGGA